MEGKGRYLIGGVLAMALVLGAFFLGRSMGAKSVRVEAIKAGHAKHVITDDLGNTAFQWLEKGDK